MNFQNSRLAKTDEFRFGARLRRRSVDHHKRSTAILVLKRRNDDGSHTNNYVLARGSGI